MNPVDTPALQVHNRSAHLMGNRFGFTVVVPDAATAEYCLEAAIGEVQRIETLLTTFSETSITATINRNAGLAPVPVDPEVFGLIGRSLGISKLTQGAFDITYGSMNRDFWNFNTAMSRLPDPATAKASVRLIDYRNVLLDAEQQTVMLRHPGMRIGFGGIGKGYAADRVRTLLQGMGVRAGVVNASGDLATWGLRPDGTPWTIRIADPDQSSRPFSALDISNKAVATSGNYEKYVIIDGRRYSHTIDPRTGYPVAGIKSVTIICNSAELADALATPVVVMGVRVGLHLLNQLPQVAAIVIDDHDRLFTTNNININP